MRCVLVTGADGFVGPHAIAALAARYPETRLVATGRSAGDIPGAERFETLDVTDRGAVAASLERHRPDGVLHLAGISSVAEAEADPRLAYEVNLWGTHMLATAVAALLPETRFVAVSSADIYGATLQAGTGRVTEAEPIAPLNAYALSKAAGDLAVGALAARGLRAIRLRPFNHAGPGQDDRFVVSAFARQIAEAEAGQRPPVLQVGDLSAVREFIDVRDAVRAYALAFAADDRWWGGTVVNIAGGQLIPIAGVLDQLRALSRVEVAVEQDPARVRPREHGYRGGDAARATEVLGWRADIPLEQTLADVLDFWRAHIG